MRKVFLDDLPRWDKGEGTGNIGTINWSKCKGMKVSFMYDDIEGEVELIDYISCEQKLVIKYNNKTFWDKPILTGNFQKCRLGWYLNKRSQEFKINIGEILKDDKRDMIITNREYRLRKNNNQNEKWYKYKCLKCGYEGWKVENALMNGTGCSCCAGRTAVLGINTIWDKARWLCGLGISEENAKRYTPQSNQKIEVVCPDCGTVKELRINSIYRRKSIGCVCGDGLSYPEKFMFILLRQLEVEFITQLNKSTFNWCKKYKYDFYLPKYNMIIETHGLQHYEENKRGKKLVEEQMNDELKEKIARENGIENYIVIDCRYSELDWIKNSILRSELNNLLNFSQIDWDKCEEYALKNIVREMCDYWNNKEEWETTAELSKIYNVHQATVSKYLKRGVKLGWCNYDPKKEYENSLKEMRISRSKMTKCLDDNKIFSSSREAGRYYNINSSSISAVCLKKRKTAGGRRFCYV